MPIISQRDQKRVCVANLKVTTRITDEYLKIAEKVHSESHKPVIRADSRMVQGGRTQDVEAEEWDKDSLYSSLGHPHEEVLVIEDAILLTDEVYLRKEAVEIFVDAV